MEKSQTPLKARTKKHFEVLNYLKMHGAAPRVDIAAKLKLTKAAITGITNDLLLSSTLIEKGEFALESQKNRRGRRKTLLDINENYKLVFGIVLEETKLYVGLTNLKGQALDKTIIKLHDESYRQILELIVEKINKIMNINCINLDKILAISICVSQNGLKHIDAAFIKDKLIKIKKDLTHAFLVKVIASSTIDGACLAQRLFSGEPNISNLIMLRYGAQVESSLLLNGKIFKGDSFQINGFLNLQQKENTLTYSDYLKNDDIKNRLNENLAQDIKLYQSLLDIKRIFGFGEYFELPNCILEISKLINHPQKDYKFEQSIIREDNLYLCPCAVAIEEFFYNNTLTQ